MQKTFFAPLRKVTDADDGSIMVTGVASTESADSTGETILASAIKKALLAYKKYPAIREMHRSTSAAGRAVEIAVDDDGMPRGRKSHRGCHGTRCRHCQRRRCCRQPEHHFEGLCPPVPQQGRESGRRHKRRLGKSRRGVVHGPVGLQSVSKVPLLFSATPWKAQSNQRLEGWPSGLRHRS
jgi:hypothetical protein